MASTQGPGRKHGASLYTRKRFSLSLSNGINPPMLNIKGSAYNNGGAVCCWTAHTHKHIGPWACVDETIPFVCMRIHPEGKFSSDLGSNAYSQ